MQQQSRATKDLYNIWEKKEAQKVWGRGRRYLDCLHVLHELQSQAVLSWHHHLLISSRSFHRLMDKAMGQRNGWQWGLESVVQLLRLCLLSVVCEQHPIKSQHGHSGSSKKERGKNMETKRKKGERGRGGAMSCLWPERREGPGIWLITGRVRVQGQCPGSISL